MERNERAKGIAKAHAAKLADMVDYEEGSVVSRTLIDRKAGTVTLFAFEKSQRLSEHKTPYDALLYLLDGEAEITISGNATRVREGEMILIPAKKPHELRAVTRFKMILTMIRS